MQRSHEDLTQKERIASLLMAINKNVTEKDRADFLSGNGTTRSTLSNYMNGKVANLDLAVKMLQFFQKRIAEREELLHAF